MPPPNLNARFLEVKDIIAYRGMDQDIDLTPELKHLLSKCKVLHKNDLLQWHYKLKSIFFYSLSV